MIRTIAVFVCGAVVGTLVGGGGVVRPYLKAGD